jgi:hypothetical protein
MDYVVRSLRGDGDDGDFGAPLATVHASYCRVIPLFATPCSAVIEISTKQLR